MKRQILIFVVCYNAEQFVARVIDRIPDSVWHNSRYDAECLIIDDQSTDQTFHKATEHARRLSESKITVLHNPQNQGYGGNQKIGYYYAIEHHFDVVLLLHGDGQYPPEQIDAMLQPIFDGDADAVLGSRMIDKRQALKGRMPFYKWIGNQVLTRLQNWLLGSRLSEFHTGFRAYSVPALASIPFQYNSNYFDFDTDIIIQLWDTRKRIKEIPIPTYYGEEVSRVNGFRYGLLVLRTTLLSRVMPRGIFYHPKFDYHADNSYYTLKLGFASSHQFTLDRIRPGSTALDLGCGPGFMARELAKKQVRTISVDRIILQEAEQYSYKTVEADVEAFDFSAEQTDVDYVLMLDIIEHLKSPEALIEKIRDHYGNRNLEVIITTGNIAFAIIRLGLLFGQFNYGKRGILDLDHSRLFTFYALRRLLTINGFEICEERGIPAPFPLALGDGPLARILLAVNSTLIRLSRGLFSYQIAIVARPKPTLAHLLKDAEHSSQELLQVSR